MHVLCSGWNVRGCGWWGLEKKKGYTIPATGVFQKPHSNCLVARKGSWVGELVISSWTLHYLSPDFHHLYSFFSGVAPANQTKERSVHELFTGAFRNKSFLRKNTRSHKMDKIHELFVLALSLVWFAGVTPDFY